MFSLRRKSSPGFLIPASETFPTQEGIEVGDVCAQGNWYALLQSTIVKIT